MFFKSEDLFDPRHLWISSSKLIYDLRPMKNLRFTGALMIMALAVVAVRDGRSRVIVRRESAEDLLRLDAEVEA